IEVCHVIRLLVSFLFFLFFFSSRRRHTRFSRDWSSDVCSSDLNPQTIYIRITNTVTLCYQAIPLDLIVHLPPQVNLLTTVEICDNEAQTYDLTLVNEWIVSNPNAVTITYYTSLSDAETGQNPITGEYP